MKSIYGYALAVYLAGIGPMMNLLEYPDAAKPIKGRVQVSLFVAVIFFPYSHLSFQGLILYTACLLS